MPEKTQRKDSSIEQIDGDVHPQTERFLDTAATEVDELSLLTSQFVDDAESGDATERDLLDVHCRLISASIAIRDAAHTADVVDTDRARYHQIDDLLSAVAHACRAQRRDPDAQHRRDRRGRTGCINSGSCGSIPDRITSQPLFRLSPPASC